MPKTEMLENEPQAKVVDYGQLSNHQKRIITTIASKNIGIDRIANLLKPLKFCTPQTTLKVVEESKVLSDEDFQKLKAKLLEPTADELKQVEKTEQTAAKAEQTIAKTEQTAEEPTTSEQTEEPIKAEPEKKKDERMSEEETVMIIKMHLDGKSNAEIAQALGRSTERISKRISYAKTTQKYGYLFDKSDNTKPIEKTSAEIRAKMAVSGVKQYKVAEALGMAETAFSRKLRYGVSDAEKERIMTIIDNLSANRTKGEETMQQKTTDKCYVAKGTGYTIVDAIGENITVNGNSVLRELTKYFQEIGLDEFYGKVEVRITVLDKLLEMQISEE